MQRFSTQSDCSLSTKWLDLKEVAARTRLGKSTIYLYIHTRGFPRPVKVGHRSHWAECEIEAWMRDQMDGRPGGPWQHDTAPDRVDEPCREVPETEHETRPARVTIRPQQPDVQQQKQISSAGLVRLHLVKPEFYFDLTTNAIYVQIMRVEPSLVADFEDDSPVKGLNV